MKFSAKALLGKAMYVKFNDIVVKTNINTGIKSTNHNGYVVKFKYILVSLTIQGVYFNHFVLYSKYEFMI